MGIIKKLNQFFKQEDKQKQKEFKERKQKFLDELKELRQKYQVDLLPVIIYAKEGAIPFFDIIDTKGKEQTK